MKKYGIILSFSMLFLGISSSAFAGGHKVDIFHCGCNIEGDALEWQAHSVSNRANGNKKNSPFRGHANHEAGDTVVCILASDESMNPLTRGVADCVVTTGDLDDIQDCATVLVGGFEFLQEDNNCEELL